LVGVEVLAGLTCGLPEVAVVEGENGVAGVLKTLGVVGEGFLLEAGHRARHHQGRCALAFGDSPS
jgi:hypothetical protein